MMFAVHHAVACIWCLQKVIESEDPITPELHNQVIDAHMPLCPNRQDMVVWTALIESPTLPIEVMVPALFERKFS